MMKVRYRGWKEGIMKEDLIGFGYTHKKGDVVRYKRCRAIGDDKLLGRYEYHYMDLNNYNLVRSRELHVEIKPDNPNGNEVS